MKKYASILFLALIVSACSGEADPDEEESPVTVYPAQISAPMGDAQYVIGETVNIDIKVDVTSGLSELKLFMDDTIVSENLELKDQTIIVETIDGNVGWTTIRIEYLDGEGQAHSDMREIVFFSDVIPGRMNTTIVNTLPHQGSSYTQGLEFYQGQLYEGTGQWGTSFLGKVDLNSGDVLKQVDLDESVFGEGITILNDTIYQITWQNNTCYAYDMNFNLLTEFTYEGEGWGLCNDGEYIMMSSGSQEIVWRDPRTFKVVKRMDVFDNDSSVDNLNELELIDGYLYANIYTSNDIAKIDTTNGKVITYFDCTHLASDALGGDVLNGIAQNGAGGKIYLTGKYWPKLYEVTFE